MPEIRIGRIVIRLTTPRIVIILIISTTDETEIAIEMESAIRATISIRNILSVSNKVEGASPCRAELRVCDALLVKSNYFFQIRIISIDNGISYVK
jgi:hypothetical protein